MKISLAGPSYTSRSVVAAAQQTMNLYPEAVETPNEPTKLVLYGRPGLQVFATLSPAKIRCLWAGGGRLFVVHGNTLSEVNQAGTATARTGTLAESVPAVNPDKAWIASNGHQLMIVSGGFVYCDNGAGPEQAFFQLSGTGDTFPTGVGHTLSNVLTRDSGTPFTAAMVGGPITINGRSHTVAIFSDDTHLVIDPPAPTESDIRWIYTGTNDPTISTNILSRDSGDSFLQTPTLVGKTITINGRNYEVTSVTNSDILGIDPAAPPEGDVRWNVAGGQAVNGVTGGFLDGYGIINRTWPPSGPGTRVPGRRNRAGVEEDHGRQFNISGLNDFTFWDPLDFGVKEGHSDYIVQVHCDHEELWLLGSETTEVWTNVGDPNFPFQRIPGAYIDVGSAAIAACSVGTSVCWLAGGAYGQTVAVRAQGFQPQRISTHAQEEAWNAPGFRVRDAVSYFYVDAGHLFWVINFWAEEKTWVYDVTSGLWHERAAWNAGTVSFLRYQPWYHVFVPEWGEGGKHIVGDPTTGILYEMSLNFYDDAGNAIEYLRAFPHLLNENQYHYHHRLEVYVESGQTPVGVPDLQLRVGLDWSDDRGHTFSHNHFAFAGRNGEYTKRVVWRRLGKSRDRVYRVGIEGKAKVALIDAFLEATPGFA